MPSLLHEGILELIREQPRFIANLLEDLLHVEVPAFTDASMADATMTQPLPIEYRADAVVLLVEDQPVLGCIVEAQLSPDPKKLFSWPLYTVSARARHECPFVLIVVTPDAHVASWAAVPDCARRPSRHRLAAQTATSAIFSRPPKRRWSSRPKGLQDVTV